MTGATPARRLLVRLIDEQVLETEPIAEVRADLAALGIDATRAIAVSRRLAANANSPAAALLRRISESEEDDDEIRRLEQMDIGAVRQGLPPGATAATAARARRAAGVDSNVVGLRRRRSRRLLYGLSGVAAAMAASLVFYVGLSTDQPFRLEAPPAASPTPVASQPVAPPAELEGDESRLNQLRARLQPQPPAAEADAAKSELADEERQRFSGAGGIQAANEPAASGMQSAAQSAPSVPTAGTDEIHPMLVPPRADQQAPADTAELQRQREKLTEELEKSGGLGYLRAESPEPSNAPQPVDLASGATSAATGSTPTTVPPLPTPEMTIIPERKPDLDLSADLAAAGTDSAATATAKEQASKGVQSVTLDAAATAAPPAVPFGLTHPIVALLIVDPGLAPPGVHQKDFPVGTLPARLGEARRLAEGRAVAALVTLQVGSRVADAIIAEDRKTRALSASAPDAESALGPVHPDYELIELDRR